MLIGLTALAGYYLQDKSGRKKEEIRDINEKDPVMLENEKPNSLNIYSGDKVNAANDELLRMSLNNYKDAEKPSLTGVLPPIYNSYSAVGNDTILNVNINEQRLSDVNNINRRTNVLETASPNIVDRPMFKLSNLGTPSEDNYSNFGTGLFSNQEVSLLSGKVLEREHSNMVPFFGSNVKQNVETFTNESKLDNYTGNRSTYIHKQERAPQFEQVSQDIYGTPLLTDHIDTSRYIASAYRQNEKPFYEERIAAPIAGTLDNPVNNIKQPTIDSLRTANKQQVSYEGRMKAGQLGSVRGITGSIIKNKPDTHFELGHSRLFTSTGAVIANQSTNNYENMPQTSRQDQNIEYYGGAIYKESLSSGPRIKSIDNTNELDFNSLFQNPKRNQLSSDTQRNVGSMIPSVNDYGKQGINLPELERDTTKQSQTLNINKGNSGHKMILQDDIKGTIKETLLGKHDNSGNIRTNVINRDNNSGITDYTFKTTNKEMLIDNNYNGHVNKKDGMGYSVVNAHAKTTNKELTSDYEYAGHANDANKNSMVYSTFENPEKVRNAVHIENYKGAGNHHTSAAQNRTMYNNAEITESKEKLLQGQRPSGRKSTLGTITNNTLGKTKLTDNMLLKERRKTRPQNVNLTSVIPTKNILGEYQPIFNNHSELENNRLNASDVSMQLSSNPFFNLK